MLSASVYADGNQAIAVNADYAKRNEVTGLTEYRGNVVIRQGTTLINADRVIIYYEDDKVSRISCTGAPARYQQMSAIDDNLIIARAERIEYLVTKDEIKLKKNGTLTRNGTSIKGNSINYYLEKGNRTAKGKREGEKKRIQLVIPPFNQNTIDKELPSEKETSSDQLKDIT